jgi:lipid-binding SYLF domain-containing protein
MVTHVRTLAAVSAFVIAGMITGASTCALAASAGEIDAEVDRALHELYSSNAQAKVLGTRATAVLVFPDVVKAGFIGGLQFGEGALRSNGRTTGYYSSVAGSYGLQAGIQKFSYALFFMSDSALNYLRDSGGWEIGTGPSIVVVDEGLAKSLTSTTLTQDVYAVFFDQKGLFAGLGLQGTKITKIDK